MIPLYEWHVLLEIKGIHSCHEAAQLLTQLS